MSRKLRVSSQLLAMHARRSLAIAILFYVLSMYCMPPNVTEMGDCRTEWQKHTQEATYLMFLGFQYALHVKSIIIKRIRHGMERSPRHAIECIGKPPGGLGC